MFKKVLIANRGEVARRVVATCRRLGVRSVAVYSDADASAPNVTEADEAYRLGEAPLAKSYLNVPALLEALERSGADAVHPGYGLLSESAAFAEAVRGRGAAFVGPSVEALRVFGSKLESRALARSLGIEPPPGTGQAVDPNDPAALERAARDVGLPLIVKAAGGGGGIGMLRVDRIEDVARAAATCAQRGRAAFNNPEVYIERYLDRPRHVEVQVIAAGSTQLWALGERECSVQRRHQKLIEEAPSPAGFLEQPGARAALHAAACKIIAAHHYAGLATVEFVVDAAGKPYFLEVNPRLQVEHGITELVFGLDLVELQLLATAGDPLPPLPSACHGHAIEARVYAEDPERNFAPQPGEVTHFSFPGQGPDFRVDTALGPGDVVTPHYDPLLAKVMARGATREQAIERLLEGLQRAEVQLTGKTGPKRNNLTLLKDVLADPTFRSGQYTTHLLDERSRAQRA